MYAIRDALTLHLPTSSSDGQVLKRHGVGEDENELEADFTSLCVAKKRKALVTDLLAFRVGDSTNKVNSGLPHPPTILPKKRCLISSRSLALIAHLQL